MEGLLKRNFASIYLEKNSLLHIPILKVSTLKSTGYVLTLTRSLR